MIFDNLKNIGLYLGVNKNLDTAIKFLEKGDFSFEGKFELDGTNVFMFKDEYTTKLPEDTAWESHDNYMDIQLVLQGEEVIGMTSREDSVTSVPYDGEKDLEFYTSDSGKEKFPVLTDGDFLVIFPHEVHCPKMMSKEQSPVKKMVVKVKL